MLLMSSCERVVTAALESKTYETAHAINVTFFDAGRCHGRALMPRTDPVS